jgi:tetratricopeptide (TPR) repeat protein
MDYESRLALGKLRREEGKPAEAEDALKGALILRPGDVAAEDELARAYDDMGRFDEEARLLEKLIAFNPRDYSSYSRLAVADVRLGRPAEAKKTYARAKKIAATEADAYIDDGYFELDAGEYDSAQRDFENAIAVDTGSPAGYHHMGSYLSRMGRNAEAEAYFRKALRGLESDPKTKNADLVHTLIWLGTVIQAQGRYPEAEAVYLKGAAIAEPGGDGHMHLLQSLGALYLLEGKDAQAEESYARAVSAAREGKCRLSHAGRALIDLGKFYLARGRRAEAEGMEERAEDFCRNASPGQGLILVLRSLASFDARLGDAAKERAIYDRLAPARKSAPRDPDLAWVETGLGRLAASEGRFAEAESRYRLAIELLDRSGDRDEEADALDGLAAACEKGGAVRRAAAVREKAGTLRTGLFRHALP